MMSESEIRWIDNSILRYLYILMAMIFLFVLLTSLFYLWRLTEVTDYNRRLSEYHISSVYQLNALEKELGLLNDLVFSSEKESSLETNLSSASLDSLDKQLFVIGEHMARIIVIESRFNDTEFMTTVQRLERHYKQFMQKMEQWDNSKGLPTTIWVSWGVPFQQVVEQLLRLHTRGVSRLGKELDAKYEFEIKQAATYGGILLVIGIIIAYQVNLRIKNILQQQWESAQALREVNNALAQSESNLQQLNSELEQRVEKRTVELANSNDHLQETLTTLQYAQEELVRSEKLASLGSLVAGVAHELNTPLGNSMTLSTTMRGWQDELDREFTSGNLNKSTLTDFLDKTKNATGMLVFNVTRAAELVSDFKQVAVDQTSAKRREFDLQSVIDENIETLQPQFKKTSHNLVMDIPSDIMMDSYPGPLGQVITNLSLNALLYGFDGLAKGLVQVKAEELSADQIELVVEDNGCGIPKKNFSKVFDPFFTTKFGQGGSGLGMHIVYTLITKLLGGSVKLEQSQLGGAKIIIKLPREAPQMDSDDTAGVV